MTTTTRPSRTSSRRAVLARLDVRLTPYVFISPFFVLFFLVGLFPILYTAWVSLHEWDLIRGQGEFVGLANFQFVLGTDSFYKALRNTFSIFLLSSVPQVIAAIFIAYILDANLRAKTFWRMGVLVPFIVAPVAVSMIFAKIFADQSGLVNNLLMGMDLPAIGWHSDALASHFAIATMVNFRWTGYNALIFLAAMQAIPREIYEAAIIDGTGRMRRFWHVTVPMLRPTIIFVVITSTIGGLQIFDEPRMFDTAGSGGASRQWMTMTMYLYELGWGPQVSFGRASAVAWLLFMIIIGIGILNYLITKRIATAGGPAKTER
ncbi:MAG: carbohydrate ABC transporter permease [Brachybacterium sp.]|uniref:carbohydrate ABC transporter permease n=1 Tax=Brachybacterium sp. TaxID=1891286 RepID=UPI00264C93BF|nr:sugar ABC transporter permease [Brachybacterium sp.]MDN6302684.1 sugar ABC transporter permease [Brachybacterium sp.]MDN6327816.1 sugar ABC transporter permease [Brachybacterium sp.]